MTLETSVIGGCTARVSALACAEAFNSPSITPTTRHLVNDLATGLRLTDISYSVGILGRAAASRSV